MSKELVVSATRHETKVAILEDDQLVEVYFQRSNEYSLAGSIHKGRVTRVLPGMQSAFVDLGLERDTFLYVSDFFEENEEYDRIGTKEDREVRSERGPRAEARTERAPEPSGFGPEAAPPSITETDAPPAVPPAPAGRPTERQDDGEGRDRRGRRSRRRRSRGRGFPDSKYASETRSVGAPIETPSVVEPEKAPDSASGEFSVLPGESLAKYRRSNIEPLDDQEQEEIRNAQEQIDDFETENEQGARTASDRSDEPESLEEGEASREALSKT